MFRPIRLFEGRFGRVALADAGVAAAGAAGPEPMILFRVEGAEGELTVGGERVPFGRRDIVLVNPGERYAYAPGAGGAPARLLAVVLARGWLRERFPALGDPAPAFPRAHEEASARIRRLADALAAEIRNDQFVAAERIEFMLQELMLSLVETYLAKRRAASPLWRGSRFADQRIRRAIQLLRARPNKDVNIDALASQVGLSRSRFYDLFQLCTGHSPRAYLDMLCVEAAIARLASGAAKISELSAELGFSAQSNFTRFFLNRVGISPSKYRRASSRREDEGPGASG
jgi:AraC-like DNA-binding protein